MEMIERTVVASPTFFEEKKTQEDEFGRKVRRPPNFTSCLDVLENICTAFSARFTQARFGFWFIPPNAFNWSHDLNVQSWTRTQVASENIATPTGRACWGQLLRKGLHVIVRGLGVWAGKV